MTKQLIRYQLTLQFDTELTRSQFDELALRLVKDIEHGRIRKLPGECVYVATELITTNLLRNKVADGIETGVG